MSSLIKIKEKYNRIIDKLNFYNINYTNLVNEIKLPNNPTYNIFINNNSIYNYTLIDNNLFFIDKIYNNNLVYISPITHKLTNLLNYIGNKYFLIVLFIH